MIPELDTYDWHSAFSYAGEDGSDTHADGASIRISVPGSGVPTHPFTREDVTEILGTRVGENDESDWLIAGKLRDGRYFFLEAGCDYTGWG